MCKMYCATFINKYCYQSAKMPLAKSFSKLFVKSAINTTKQKLYYNIYKAKAVSH